MCGVPTATLANGNITYVAAIVRDIKGAGRQPVLLSEWPLPLRAYRATLRQILRMRVNEDTNTLVSPPRVTGIETENLWMAQP
jgi:hypothetical protein